MKRFLILLLSAVLALALFFSSCISSDENKNKEVSSDAQAIAIAPKYVPPNIVDKARIQANQGVSGGPNGSRFVWHVEFMDVSVTKADLGWKPDDITDFGPDEPYTEVQIGIDSLTGKLLYKRALIPAIWGI